MGPRYRPGWLTTSEPFARCFTRNSACARTPTNPAPRTIYIALPNSRALRHGDWKLIHPAKGPPQLFHLSADPYETTDLAKTEPTKLTELEKLLAEQYAKDNQKLPEDLEGFPK